MSLNDWANLLFAIAGSMWAVITLFLAIASALVLYFGLKGMRAAHELMATKVIPAVERAQAVADQVQERTAILPGAPGSDSRIVDLPAAVRGIAEIEPPFRSRKRTWLPFRR